MKKFRGIIPEAKLSEKDSCNCANCSLNRIKDYPVLSINTSSIFGGSLELLKIARNRFPKKFLIRKDFIMVPKQVKESKEAGADAVLLIRYFLSNHQYKVLLEACDEHKIISIVEVNSGTLNYTINNSRVLVNSRDLNTGKFYKKRAEEVCKVFKDTGFNVIYASGENSGRVVKEGIADAVLIGTAFMQDKLK